MKRRQLRLVPSNSQWTDGFCGAGGESIGIKEAGGQVALAANHWERAIETHSTNFPDTDHLCADLINYDWRTLPPTDFAWFSHECTWHSPAGGRRRRRAQLDMFDDYVPDAAGERSRMTMAEVIRAAEVHRYLVLIVENVIEVTDWELFGWWVSGLEQLGYDVQLVSVNSAHIWDDENTPAPQWRDRFYAVCTLKGLRRPDVTPRPLALCEQCADDVFAVQVFKRGRTFGKYRQQYVYVCPAGHGQIEPYVAPALMAIDWTDIGIRIGDRTRPLAAATERRIRAGAHLFWEPVTLKVGGNTYERPGSGYHRVWPVTDPMVTRTKTPEDALACPPLVLNTNHGGDDGRPFPVTDRPLAPRTTKIGDGVVTPYIVYGYSDGVERRVKPVSEPLGTIVANGRGHYGLTLPEAFLTMLRANGRPRGVDEPMPTLSTGRNHVLTVPPGSFITKHHGGLDYAGVEHMVKSVIDPLATVVAKPNMSLIIPYDRTARARRAVEPMTTLTTRDRHAIVTADIDAIDISDFHFRMLQPREHLAAQRFPALYVVRGNKGEQTMQAGNAVSCNVARWLVRQSLAIFDGTVA